MVVLCAEDDEWVRQFIVTLLKADGFTVLAAGDGKAALEEARKYSGTIDLLVSDVTMPRMGGLELRRTIAVERPEMKVLMMSGALESREKVATIGLPFLQKPFSSTALRESIETVLSPITSTK
jgi:DNA-binding response OmpR family regulator